MANGTKALRKIQLGRETTAGTAVASTTVWRGTGTIKNDMVIEAVAEDVGYLGGTDRNVIKSYLAHWTADDTPATFEQLPHILEAAIETDSPATDGSAYVYEYNFPTTAVNTIKTYTIEGGDNAGAEEMEYCFVESFRLAGSAGEPVTMGATWVGRQVVPTTFTAGQTAPSVEEIIFTKGTLSIDAVSGNVGATAKSSTLLGFSLDVNTGIIPKFAANGQLYYDFHQFTMPEVLLQLTYEHGTNAIAEKVFYQAGTSRLFRLQFNGATLQTAGSTYTTKAVRIDLAGYYESWDAISDQNGNDVVTCTVRARYEGTESLFANIYVANLLSALP